MAAEPTKKPQPIFVPVPEDLPEDFDLRELGYSHEGARSADGTTRSAFVLPTVPPRQVGLGAADSGTTPVRPLTAAAAQVRPVAPAPPRDFIPQLTENLILWRAKLERRFQTPAFDRFKYSTLGGMAVLFVAAVTLWLIGLNAAAPGEARLQIVYRSQLEGQKQIPVSPALLKTIEAQITLDDSLLATGTALVPDQKATGQMRISNTTERTLGLSAGTVIATVNGVSYRLTQAVSVPGSNFAAGQLGSVVVTVQADKPGPVGNIPGGLGTLNLAQGLKAAGIGPLAGGTMREAKIVSKADLEALRQKLEAQLPTKANETLLAQVESGWQPLAANPMAAISEPQIMLEPAEGAEVGADGKVSGKITARVSLAVYNPTVLAEQVAAGDPNRQSANFSSEQVRLNDSGPPSSAMPNLPAPQFSAVTLKQVTLLKNSETPVLNINYSQAIVPPNLQKILDGWVTGDRATFDKLMKLLQERPDVEAVKLTLLEPDKKNLKLKCL